MKKFKPNYSFADLWKNFVMFTKNWRRKSTGELVCKDKLEIDNATITTLNGEELPSVKPIYVHPVYCSLHRYGDDLLVTFTCLIFNNSPTPFTTASFMEYCKALFAEYPTASIMVSGYAAKDPLSRVQNAPLENQLQLQSPNSTGVTNDYWTISLTDMEAEGSVFVDGVNKIN